MQELFNQLNPVAIGNRLAQIAPCAIKATGTSALPTERTTLALVVDPKKETEIERARDAAREYYTDDPDDPHWWDEDEE